MPRPERPYQLYALEVLQAMVRSTYPERTDAEVHDLAKKLRKELHKLNQQWYRSEKKWKTHVALTGMHYRRPSSPDQDWRL